MLFFLGGCREDTASVDGSVTADSGPALSTAQNVTVTATIGEIPSPSPPTPSRTPQPYDLPPPSPTPRAYAYPDPDSTRTPPPTARATREVGQERSYLPFASSSNPPGTASATATSGAEISSNPTPTAIEPAETPQPVATLDVRARQLALEGTDRQLGFSKIGFHVTFLQEKGVLDDWMQQLDAAGIPFFLKTVDNAEPLYKAQQLMQESGVPHTLVYRATGGVPDYSLPPAEAAREHWNFHRDKFPPELDPDHVWLETVNEVDKNRSAWLAEFALESARLALADGFRWAAFGWAPGEPEPEDWQLPAMQAFLRLAVENPDRLAIAVHEGSLSADNIKELYPYRLGRFLELYRICDELGIPRPTVLVTEWGWEYNNIPPVDQAMADIAWAANLYAHFPEVKGAAIWNLGTGCCFGNVSDEVHELIEPLRRFNLTTAYEIPRAPAMATTDPSAYE